MSDETCWTLIQGAAGGDESARAAFVRLYDRMVRGYLGARWKNTPWWKELDDAAQDVFLHCFREGGALERVDPTRSGGFRAYLYGVIRRTAQSIERDRARAYERRGDASFHPEQIMNDETSLSRILDREWARAVFAEADKLFATRARDGGEACERRVELLHLSFRENKSVPEIATEWGVDADYLHHQKSQAKKEFGRALREIVAQHTGKQGEPLDGECTRVFELMRAT